MTVFKSNALQRLIDALRDHGSEVRESGAQIMAQCPAHDDKNPSLSINQRRDGRGVVLKCHAGCEYTDVLAALEMTDSDLFDDDKIRDALWPTKTYVYVGGRKNHRGVKDGKKTFWQEGSDDLSLYAVDTVKPGAIVYMCEGEKAADYLRAMGYTAVATGGSQRTCDIAPLAGHVVTLIADRDDAGRDWARRYAVMLKPVAVFVSIVQAKVQIEKADVVEHMNAGYTIDELEPVSIANGHEVVVAEPEQPKRQLEDVEQGFWEARESLAQIKQTALARMCPPWAVLAHAMARGLTLVRPHVTLPPLIGGPGSLNWFAAVVARSGGGKGASSACAELLIPDHIETRNVGSGEGIVAAFGRPADDGDPTPTHEALLFTADEVDTLAALNQRTASTTLSILRSGFSGETLGFSYAATDKRRHIGRHTYRMTLVVSIQPTRAGWLLADEGGGTPQRFMWFPGVDKRIQRNKLWVTGPLELPHHTEWQYPREIVVPDAATDLILDERVKAMQGEQDALDGHALFCREKCAFGLAVLDGRIEMTPEDWELSGIIADVSTFVRDETVAALEEASRMDAIDRGEIRGTEMAAADIAKDYETAERRRRILRSVLERIDMAGPDGLLKRELNHKVAGRDKKFLDGALAQLTRDGLIHQDDETGRWIKL